MGIAVSIINPPIAVTVQENTISVAISSPQISVAINTGGGTSASGVSTTPITVSGQTVPSSPGWTFCPVYNNSGSPFTVYLPSSPAENQIVSLADALNNAGTHAIILNGNGKNISAYGTSDLSSIEINSNGGSIDPLVWDSEGNQWTQFG